MITSNELRKDYKEFTIAKDGNAVCNVVVSKNASEKVLRAADDFANLLKRMCGDAPKIFTDEDELPENPVLIGPSRYTEKEGFAAPTGYPENEVCYLKNCDNRCIILMGNDDGDFTGTEFAVTMFFERLGCGWFGPQEIWQVIPENKDISIGYLDIEHRPQFIARYNNVLRFYPEIGKRWYLGGIKRVAGHAFQSLFHYDKYFESHPEWYCMINGKRDPMSVEWWQFCYSNEELPKRFAEAICKIFDEDPFLTQYSIALNDGWYEGWCECDECRKMGTPSEIAVEFSNRIAREVAKKYPNHILTFLAYFPTYFPPTKPMKVEPNVEVMFCKECDMFMPVDKGPDNGYHLRYSFKQSKNTYPEPWLKNFKKWISRVDFKHISIWDWYCIAAAQPEWKDIPWVQGDVITRNHRFWHEHNVEYIYNDQGPLPAFYEDGDSFALRWPLWYVNARGMWEKELTGSQILMDACKKLYGAAADILFSYYLALADIAAHNEGKTIAWHPPKPHIVYTDTDVVRIDRILKGIELVKDELSPVELERVKIQLKLWETAKTAIQNSAKGMYDEKE